MTLSQSLKLSFLSLCALANAAPAPASDLDLGLGFTSRYDPVTTRCPAGKLVRPANGISDGESSYVTSRKANADTSLASWLQKQGNFRTENLPVVGITSSGGGYRALLEAAGVVQGLDIRDSSVGTSGVYQGLTYEAGLSGGSWFMSSLAGNNWPTVSSLRDDLWEDAFENSLLLPAHLLSLDGLTEYGQVVNDITQKAAAGYDVTIVDPYGRLLSYQLLDGYNGGVGVQLSGLTSLSNFTQHNVPYPIIITTTNFPNKGQCEATINGPIFEFHPYEYGSWDNGVTAFAKTQYMGTDMSQGKPTDRSECTQNYDNLGYVFGTSSDIFPGLCGLIEPTNSTNDLADTLEGMKAKAEKPVADDVFGVYPNPFYNYNPSPLVQNQQELYLSDGGLAGQNLPIWPFIQPARDVDVLIANDNSADTDDNFPNGTEIRQTYLNAQAVGLPKMPFIPAVDVFVSEGLNKRATFFGCDEPEAMTIVYMPNVNYTFPSNQPTSKIVYAKDETAGMIANGVEIATQNGDEQWPFCLACAINNADAELPEECGACFDKYCYRR